MKEEWEYRKLLEVCDFQGGSQPPKSEWIDHEETGYVRMLQIRDYTQSRNVSPEYVKLTKKTKCCSVDDIMIGRYGASLGKILTGLGGAYNVAIMKTIPNENVLIKRYLRFYLLSTVFQHFLLHIGGRAAQAGFSKEDLNGLLIPLPPLSEQQRIVTCLDSSFSKIDELKENVAKELSDAKALFQAELKKCMEKKEGWEKKKLGEIITDSADGPFGSNLKKEHYTSEKQVRIIQLSNIGEEGWREENTKYTTFEHLKNISRSEVKAGDIVIAKMMPAGRAIICPSHESKFVLSSDAVRIKLREGFDVNYILLHINSPHFRNQVYANVSGSGRVRTSLTKLRECSVSYPSLDKQHQIVTHLDTLSQKIQELEKNYNTILAECDALKQAILRETFE